VALDHHPIMGMTMGEIFELKELGEDCAADKTYEFLFVAPAHPDHRRRRLAGQSAGDSNRTIELRRYYVANATSLVGISTTLADLLTPPTRCKSIFGNAGIAAAVVERRVRDGVAPGGKVVEAVAR